MTAPVLLTTAQIKTAQVTDSTATPTLTLASNTVYSCTNAAITTLTISGVNTGFEYAAIIFNSPSTASSIAMPSGWVCVGVDVTSGVFVPVADKRYNLAVQQEYDRVAVYVMEG